MKKTLFVIVIALAALATASAATREEMPEVEIFGGYSLLKLGASNDKIRPFQEELYEGAGDKWNADSTSFFLSRGAAGSLAFNLNEYFSIVADARYNQGDLIKGSFELISPETSTTIRTPLVVGVKNLSVLTGPRISLRKKQGTAFVHALAGLDYWRLNGDYTVAGEEISEGGDKFGPGVAIGGGLDVNVNEKFAVRVIQADYYLTRQMERFMNNVNLSFGIVLRIGEKVLR